MMARPALIIGIAIVLFLTNGAEAVHGFLESDVVVEILGLLGVVLSVALGYLVRRERKEKAGAAPPA
jgi:hypothetical protein